MIFVLRCLFPAQHKQIPELSPGDITSPTTREPGLQPHWTVFCFLHCLHCFRRLNRLAAAAPPGEQNRIFIPGLASLLLTITLLEYRGENLWSCSVKTCMIHKVVWCHLWHKCSDRMSHNILSKCISLQKKSILCPYFWWEVSSLVTPTTFCCWWWWWLSPGLSSVPGNIKPQTFLILTLTVG